MADRLCDGYPDCPDRSDERACAGCAQFTCPPGARSAGACLGPEQVCDGVSDCGGGEDEEDCLVLGPRGLAGPEVADSAGLLHTWVGGAYVLATLTAASQAIEPAALAAAACSGLQLRGEPQWRVEEVAELLGVEVARVWGRAVEVVGSARVLRVECGERACPGLAAMWPAAAWGPVHNFGPIQPETETEPRGSQSIVSDWGGSSRRKRAHDIDDECNAEIFHWAGSATLEAVLQAVEGGEAMEAALAEVLDATCRRAEVVLEQARVQGPTSGLLVPLKEVEEELEVLAANHARTSVREAFRKVLDIVGMAEVAEGELEDAVEGALAEVREVRSCAVLEAVAWAQPVELKTLEDISGWLEGLEFEEAGRTGLDYYASFCSGRLGSRPRITGGARAGPAEWRGEGVDYRSAVAIYRSQRAIIFPDGESIKLSTVTPVSDLQT